MALVSAVHDEVYPPEETEDEMLPAEEAAEALAPSEPPEEEPFEPPAPGELPPDVPTEPVYDVSPWEVLFYPDDAKPGIVEVILGTAAY